MKISGIQKVTLIDYPGKVACTLFLFGCNFRCGFCHNPELVLGSIKKKFSKEEVLGFLEKRKEKLEGVCITGGEPLVSLDKYFLREIKNLGYSIKLDTNGSFPEKLKEIIDEGLVNFIAMDIKGCKEDYSEIVGVKIEIEKIEESIKLIVTSGLDYEFRTTIVPEIHDEQNVKEMCKWIFGLAGRKPKKYCLQGFANNGKFVDSGYQKVKNVNEERLKELKEIVGKYFEDVEVRC